MVRTKKDTLFQQIYDAISFKMEHYFIYDLKGKKILGAINCKKHHDFNDVKM